MAMFDKIWTNSINRISESENQINIDKIKVKITGIDVEFYIIRPYSYIKEYYDENSDGIVPDIVRQELIELLGLVKWIKENVPINCSRNVKYNKDWGCCGFFAPILYYATRVNKTNQETNRSEIIEYQECKDHCTNLLTTFIPPLSSTEMENFNINNTSTEIINYSRLFFKAITGYNFDKNNHTDSWNMKCLDWHSMEDTDLKIGKTYIFNIISRKLHDINDINNNTSGYCNTYHHFFVKRISDDYVIIADSWCWADNVPNRSHMRDVNIRAVTYENFNKIIKTINETEYDFIIKQYMYTFFFVPFMSSMLRERKPLTFPELVYIMKVKDEKLLSVIEKINNDHEYKNAIMNYGGAKNKNRKTNRNKKQKTKLISTKNKKQKTLTSRNKRFMNYNHNKDYL